MDYEPNHPIWYKSDAEQMLKDGIIDEEDLKDAEIIDDYEDGKCCICGNEGRFLIGEYSDTCGGYVCMDCQNRLGDWR
jgi:hypothetical protein